MNAYASYPIIKTPAYRDLYAMQILIITPEKNINIEKNSFCIHIQLIRVFHDLFCKSNDLKISIEITKIFFHH